MKRENMARKASEVSLATLISRILGYARDMVIAGVFGASMAADAFFVAYKIPNLLRRLLGEGSLSTSLIPVYTGYLAREENEDADALVRGVFGVFGLLFILLTAAGIIFAPFIVRLIAPGFLSDPEKFALTVLLTRIMFPFLAAVGFGAITLGILNSWKLYFIPAVAPSLLSLSEILFILFLAVYFDPPIKALAYGVVAGGFAQFFIQLIPIIKRLGRPLFSLDFRHPGIKRIGRLMLPAIIGLSIFQVNSFVDTICATLLVSGSVTHLYYANRLMQFPLALFGTAVATVMLPEMAAHAAKGRDDLLNKTLSDSLRSVSFLIIPSSAGFIFLGRPIIQMLFERGRFLSADTSAAYFALALYSIGLFFYAGVKVFVSAFHSLQDTKTPVKIASIAMLLNVILNISVVMVPFLRERLSSGGLALATAAASALNFILLALVYKRMHGSFSDKLLLGSVTRHIIASAFLALFILQSSVFTGEWNLYIRTPLIIIAGASIYIFASFLLGTPEVSLLKRALKR